MLRRLIKQYPATLDAGTARLSRAILSLRAQRDDEAARELDEAIRAHGTSVVEHRRRTLEALSSLVAEAALNKPLVARPMTATDKPIERFAASFLQTGDRENAPYVLHGLGLLAAADGGWSDTLTAELVHRLVEHSPSYPPAPALLARVARSAVSAGQWPTARRAFEALITRYPDHPLSATARVELAEGLIRTGARTDARAHLERVVAAGGDPRRRALQLLVEVEEALGNRERARALLQEIVKTSGKEVASEAAYRLGRMLSADGHHAAALEWHLTAAYVSESSKWGRHALLEAGRSLTALGRTNEALTVYRKLMPRPFARDSRSNAASPPTPRAGVDQPEERALLGEAAYRIAEIVAGVGDQEAALDMYLTAAHVTAGSPAAGRALVGALRSLVAMGDRPAAEAIYQRLLAASDNTEPALLAEARRILRDRGNGQGGGSALPRMK